MAGVMTECQWAPDEQSGSGLGYASKSLREGTTTTRMPAAVAACTPLGASSITKHSSTATPIFFAVARKQSGAGLPCSTSSPHFVVCADEQCKFSTHLQCIRKMTYLPVSNALEAFLNSCLSNVSLSFHAGRHWTGKTPRSTMYVHDCSWTRFHT